MADTRWKEMEAWEPVFHESPRRRLWAPSRWLCAITDIGRRRISNEDGYFLSPDCRLWIVADGMGGHKAGEVASALTIQAIADSMDAPVLDGYLSHGAVLGDRLMEAFAGAQDRVRGRSLSDRACQGMGSTVIAALVDGEALHVCHVGDARGYHFSEGRLRCVTNDHSLVWELVMCGLLTADEARVHPQRSKITQAIGMPEALRPGLTRVSLKPGDRVLLCSDGLWEALGDRDISRIVGSYGSMLDVASILVNEANTASGQDNITAILYEHGAGHPKRHR